MAHKREGPLVQTKAGVLDDTVPLSSLQKCIVLARQGPEKICGSEDGRRRWPGGGR
jgi:hypothetical protein